MSRLQVSNLTVTIEGKRAVHDVSFELDAGQRLGLTGESGCGKSMTALAIMGLLPFGATPTGKILLDGVDLLSLSDRELRQIRGNQIAMVFQEPMTALNPMMRIVDQIAESVILHRRAGKQAARLRALELIERVQLSPVDDIARKYPHQLSGGQRQRVVLAIALAVDPVVLIADEPTTSLDVTVQAEMLELMETLVREEGAGLLLITHDLPVLAQTCDEVAVMYGGRIVESGPIDAVLRAPRHHYTAGLIDSVALDRAEGRLHTIPGSVPGLGDFPDGCVFRTRCARADEVCLTRPPLEGQGHQVACHHQLVEEER